MFKKVLSLPKTVWLIGCISLINDSASEMVYPLLPLYLSSVLLAGLVTFFTRFSMIVLLKKDYFSSRVKLVLSYVPSAVFPAIIFPAIFLNSTGQLVFLDNPKVLAALIAVLVGYLTESVIATILSGLAVLWLLIFFI